MLQEVAMEIVENICMFSIFWSGARLLYSWVSYFDLVKYRQLFFRSRLVIMVRVEFL